MKALLLFLAVGAHAQVGGNGPVNGGASTGLVTPLAVQTTVYPNITGLGAQSQNLNMNSHKVVNVTDPSSAQDAATKNYVDNNTPLTVPDKLTRLGTTAALPTNAYANGSSGVGATLTGTGLGALTVDGVATAVGDRILVKNEADTTHNGIYQVTTTAGGAFYVLTRVADFNQNSEMIGGTIVVVDSGTVNVDDLFVLIATVTTVGTDLVQFARLGVGDRAASGANADINSFSGAGSGIGFSTNVVFNSSFTAAKAVQFSSSVYIPSGSTVTMGGVCLSSSAQAGQCGFSLDTSNLPFFTLVGGSKAYISGGIGYFNYTQATTTTTTTAGAEVTFSTLTIPANMISRAGQTLDIWCRFAQAKNTNSRTPQIRNNNAGTLTSIGDAASVATSGINVISWATLTWVSASLWINTAFEWGSASPIGTAPAQSTTPLGTQAFNEQNALTFNCTCLAGTANGDCSFLDMRVNFGGM